MQNPHPRTARWFPILAALIFLLIVAARLRLASAYPMDLDEVWTIWQSIGTPAEILRWTPYDWTPLHYQGVGVWGNLTGIDPLTMRFSSSLIFILGAAGVWALARQLFQDGGWAGGVAVALLSAFAYGLYASVLVRGYVLILALLPYALICALRYFRRPTLWRALPLALIMAGMFYVHLSAVLAFMVIALCSLLIAGIPFTRWVWRWIGPGLIAAGLALPEILTKVGVGLSGSRLQAVQGVERPPALIALLGLYREYSGDVWPLWALLAVVGMGISAVHLWRSRRDFAQLRLPLALIGWALMPIGVLAASLVFGTFSAQHTAWVLPGIALWLAWALTRLPTPIRTGITVLALALMFAPIPPGYAIPIPPLREYLPQLAANWRAGDVVLRDPKLRENFPETWDYFARVYFPQGGIAFVDQPGDHRRVWYIQTDGEQDPATRAAIEKGRVAGTFFGPWNFLIRLYEGPPDPAGIPYENGLRFHGLTVLNATSPGYPVFREGETLRLRLWWSVDRPLERDYSIAVQFSAPNGELLAQNDTIHPVGDTPRETSRWTVDGFVIEEREIPLPDTLITGVYTLNLAVYQWWDGIRVVAPGLNADLLYHAETVYIKAW